MIKEATGPAKGCSMPIIRHRISISVNPDQLVSHLVRVTLLGKVEKIFYETMWDINRKIKTYISEHD